MANHDQVKLLREGSPTWNTWRAVHRLKRVQLSGAALRGAALTDANLSDANLSDANLSEAILHAADLSDADLSDADLFRADLTGANLINAKLARANLARANLTEANLTGANLTEASLYETIFARCALKSAKGLEACGHQGPSVIDFHTLEQSAPLPLAFLRGCGLPDALISYLPSLLGSPVEFYSCFISYSSQDQQFAERLHADLQNKEVRCWFAPEDLKIGEKFRVKIDESIRVHDKLLLVLSEHSVRSDWVEKEVETAMENEQKRKQTVLFPIRLDDTVLEVESGWPADIRRSRHIGDFRDWKNHDAYQKSFGRLLRDLKAAAKSPNASS